MLVAQVTRQGDGVDRDVDDVISYVPAARTTSAHCLQVPQDLPDSRAAQRKKWRQQMGDRTVGVEMEISKMGFATLSAIDRGREEAVGRAPRGVKA